MLKMQGKIFLIGRVFAKLNTIYLVAVALHHALKTCMIQSLIKSF